MKTFQDLQELGDNENARMLFIQSAIAEHKATDLYNIAVKAQKYYDGENPTITNYQKIVFDMNGEAHKNIWAANHKLKTNFFNFVVDQTTSYLLGNGITFDKETKLSDDIDKECIKALTQSQICGVSFGMPDVLEYENEKQKEEYKLWVFDLTNFVPLYNEENGALQAGIYFWQIDSDKPLRVKLYEEDGYTDYIKRDKGEMEILKPKRPYKISTSRIPFDGTETYNGKNFDGFPIVPLNNNDRQLSEIVGKRETIDALDLASSNMVNNVDEGNLIYWIIENAGGMDEIDVQKLIDNIRKNHVAKVDGLGGETGAKARPETIEAPFAGTQATIDMLKKKLYEDFQAFDASAVSAGNQTATAIKACYVPLDLKTDRIETNFTAFLKEILRLIGSDAKPSYTRNMIVNQGEEIQKVLSVSQYLPEEFVVKKILTILGDIDQFDEIMKLKDEMDMQRMAGTQEGNNDVTDTATVQGNV